MALQPAFHPTAATAANEDQPLQMTAGGQASQALMWLGVGAKRSVPLIPSASQKSFFVRHSLAFLAPSLGDDLA